jgi:hypothetical protein
VTMLLVVLPVWFGLAAPIADLIAHPALIVAELLLCWILWPFPLLLAVYLVRSGRGDR